MSGSDPTPPAIEFGFRRVTPAEPAPGSDPELVDRLRAEIAADGPITFARFMEVALYDPERGYYTSSSARPGRAGDFLTAPEAHPVFGWTLARSVARAWDAMDRPDPFALVEYGAGAGALGTAILDGLRRDRSPLFDAIRYRPVEISAARRAELRARLDEAGLADRLVPETTERSSPETGFVVANEFLDALPVHRVTVRDGALAELLVGWDDAAERFVDLPVPPSDPRLAERLASEGVALAEGAIAEICLAIDAWVEAVAVHLVRGVLLAIDYGHPASALYAPSRSGGTLRTYLRHMVGSDPYANVGRQDLTAHVDLTALSRAAAANGFTVLGEASQAEFLIANGIGELLEPLREAPTSELPAYLEARGAVVRMIDPSATGGFRVLAFGRALPPGTTLPGFAPATPA